MQSTPQEIHELIQLSVAGKDAEIAVLRNEVERLKEEIVKLRMALEKKQGEDIVAQNGLTIDVDAVCKFVSELKDFQLSSFFLLGILRTMAGSMSPEDQKRILNSITMKQGEGEVNIFAEGDWNIKKLTNMGDLVTADRIDSLRIG